MGDGGKTGLCRQFERLEAVVRRLKACAERAEEILSEQLHPFIEEDTGWADADQPPTLASLTAEVVAIGESLAKR